MGREKMLKALLIGILMLLGGISIGGWHMMITKQEPMGFNGGAIILNRPAGSNPGEIGVYLRPLYKPTDEGTLEVIAYVVFEPYGWAIGPNGDIYIADTFNHRIQRFSSDGELVAIIGSEGEGFGQFLQGGGPERIEVDKEGNVYVNCRAFDETESWRRGVVKFSPEGQCLFSTVQTLGQKGILYMNFWVRNGLIYLQGEDIGPRGSHVVVLRVVDAETGALVREHPLYKQPASELEPVKIKLVDWIDEQGRVYFWDRMEREGDGVQIRIRRYNADWQEESFSFIVSDTPEGEIHYRCRFIGEDSNGDLYVVDTFKGDGVEADYLLKIRWGVGVIIQQNLQTLMLKAGIDPNIYRWEMYHVRVDKLGYLYIPFWDKKATTYKIIRFEQQ